MKKEDLLYLIELMEWNLSNTEEIYKERFTQEMDEEYEKELKDNIRCFKRIIRDLSKQLKNCNK